MKIKLNGKTIETDKTVLSELLCEQGYDVNTHVATAVNGKFIAKEARNTQAIKNGDEVEVVAPMQGG